MKVILYMAMTVNGMIAQKDDLAPFLTPEESASYVKQVESAGALIIGRRTYQILSKQPEFQQFLKAKVRIVVVSKNPNFKINNPLHKVSGSPKEALELLKDQKQIIVAGGGILNSAFLEQKLIDEIYLDVEPYFLSKGIQLAQGGNFGVELKFLGAHNITDNEIQLHYKVLK